ncbi:MAG: hypothetical protein HC802_18640 [Caldilineaceae bacterium]|nr:hypothetical protein [Caldilineaceae bacterium]
MSTLENPSSAASGSIDGLGQQGQVQPPRRSSAKLRDRVFGNQRNFRTNMTLLTMALPGIALLGKRDASLSLRPPNCIAPS